MQADNAHPFEGPTSAPDAARLSTTPANAMSRDNGLPLDGASSAPNRTIAEKSDTRRSSSEGASVWDADQLQEARREKTLPARKEGVTEGQYAIPLILLGDELLEDQQGAIAASAANNLAHATAGHDELIYDQVYTLL